MDGVILINKEKNYTSRDVVNIIGKNLNTKKVGHTGTLDPMAEGVLVVCVNKALKLSEMLTSDTKEYIAEAIIGLETDTLDITGDIINKKQISNISKEEINEVLKSFIGKIKQQVPKYSAVKVNGKKLYEYARNNIEVELPIKEIEIFDIELLEYNNIDKFKIRCVVSKGTYIRSLIRDIGYKLNNYATMTKLIRTRQGIFTIDKSYTIDDIKNNNFKYISIFESFPNINKVTVTGTTFKKINNGMPIENLFKEDKAFIIDKNNNLMALYINDNNICKPLKMFNNN